MRKALYEQLRGKAERAAASEMLAPTDGAYEGFISRYVSDTLEESYQQHGAALDPAGVAACARDWHSGRALTYVMVSLSAPVAAQLDAEAFAASKQEVGDDTSLGHFCSAYMARSLEAAYEADTPPATR